MARQNFQATLLELYEDQKDCDIIFSCPSIDNFGNSIIGAHKRILAVASSVFYNMFYGPSAKTSDEQFNNVDIVDIEISTFKKFLSFIYGSEIKFECLQAASEFYYAADKYKCADAIQCVSDFLLKEVHWRNSIFIYEIADIFKNDKLKAASIKEFSSNRLIVFCEDFLAAKPETIEEIFKQDTLIVNSEITLIEALERYIEYSKSHDPEIALKIRPALCQIRFLTLTFKDIIGTTLLSDKEMVGILKGLEPEVNLSKMPEGFSKETKERVNCRDPEIRKRLKTLERIYSYKNCVNCNTWHFIWNCEFVLTEHRQALHNIYKKYDHVRIWVYSDKDLKALFDIFSSAGYNI